MAPNAPQWAPSKVARPEKLEARKISLATPIAMNEYYAANLALNPYWLVSQKSSRLWFREDGLDIGDYGLGSVGFRVEGLLDLRVYGEESTNTMAQTHQGPARNAHCLSMTQRKARRRMLRGLKGGGVPEVGGPLKWTDLQEGTSDSWRPS